MSTIKDKIHAFPGQLQLRIRQGTRAQKVMLHFGWGESQLSTRAEAARIIRSLRTWYRQNQVE